MYNKLMKHLQDLKQCVEENKHNLPNAAEEAAEGEDAGSMDVQSRDHNFDDMKEKLQHAATSADDHSGYDVKDENGESYDEAPREKPKFRKPFKKSRTMF